MSLEVVYNPKEDPYALWIGETDDGSGTWVSVSDVPSLIRQLEDMPLDGNVV